MSGAWLILLMSLAPISLSVALSRSNASRSLRAEGGCFNAAEWLSEFKNSPLKNSRVHSQGNQDGVLASLFDAKNLGTTNRKFAEFGFPDDSFSTSYGNGRHLIDSLEFSPALLLDGAKENLRIHLHKHFLTKENVVGIFDQYAVPHELDYMSVDIDSCDLWLFWSLTSKYRPRVVTVEYNSNYALGDFTTQKCEPGKPYVWKGDNIYGSSLSAINLAAEHRGYRAVYVTPKLDIFLVRSDLLCEGLALALSDFGHTTGLPMHGAYTGTYGPRQELLTDFKKWLEQHPDA